MAGTGKTSIAKTVCERATADPEIMLGGSFFCSRTGVSAQRDIRCVVPTLAQLMARQSMEFSIALAQEIARDRDVQHKIAAAQVKQLLHVPLLAIKDSRAPILFVIDALDECGGDSSDGVLDNMKSHGIVSSMLKALVSLTESEPNLPVKFLVTSRPEAQIRDTSISDEKLSHILRLHSIDTEEVEADIGRYITNAINDELSVKPKFQGIITDSDMKDLVRLCDGLFIVAATAIKHTFNAGADAAVARFKKLLNASGNSLSAGAAAPLDRMYELILTDAARVSGSEATELPALLRLLASILSARMTLSIAALADLLNLEPYDVRASLSLLHAVVYVPEDDNTPGLRTLHASFGDYLLDRAPASISIPQLLGHETLTHACLDVMGKYLRFNISQTASSYEPKPSKRPDCITLSLEYACLHWAHHIDATSDTLAVDAKVDQKFRPKFLFWLEVLSTLHNVNLASKLLLMASSAVSQLPHPPFSFSIV